MKSAVVLGTITIGFVLVLLSVAWGWLFPATNSWTPEKAARISDVKARINDVAFKLQSSGGRIHKGPDPATLKTEYKELNAEFDQLKAEFKSAAVTPRTTATYMKWTGISLAAIGVVGWYAVNQLN